MVINSEYKSSSMSLQTRAQQDLLETNKMLKLLEYDPSLPDSHQDSQVAKFYANRNVFITGASGFVGKIVLEKLLRSCPLIGNVYILLREKRGIKVNKRLEDLIENKIFDRLKNNSPSSNSNHYEQLNKIHPIAGDITQPSLGICQEDIELLSKSVSVIIHSAATVKFHEPLKVAIENNVLSVANLLDFASQLNKLQVIVHISTAYSNCDRPKVLEQLYEPPIEPEKLIKMLQTDYKGNYFSSKKSSQLLHGKRPNTYTYTKACAEVLLASEGKLKVPHVPIAIIRPSIVTGTWREPIKGWVDNMNGPSGVMLAMMTGALQAMYLKANYHGDLIPVDTVANLIICSAYKLVEDNAKQLVQQQQQQKQLTITRSQLAKALREKSSRVSLWSLAENEISITSNNITMTDKQQTINNNIKVFNCVSGKHSITWKQFTDVLFEIGLEYPCNTLMRMPAHMSDFICKLFGFKQKLVTLYGRLDKMVQTLEPFTMNEWDFDCSNVSQLYEELSPIDKDIFNFDISNLQWTDYLKSYYIGCKLFVLKEDPKKVAKAQRMLRKRRLGAGSKFESSLLNVTFG